MNWKFWVPLIIAILCFYFSFTIIYGCTTMSMAPHAGGSGEFLLFIILLGYGCGTILFIIGLVIIFLILRRRKRKNQV